MLRGTGNVVSVRIRLFLLRLAYYLSCRIFLKVRLKAKCLISGQVLERLTLMIGRSS